MSEAEQSVDRLVKPEWQTHHPWCNYFMRPRKDCKMCEGLFRDYPVEEGQSPCELMKKYFPNNVKAR